MKMDTERVRRALILWLCSFLLIGSLLLVYFHAPLGPVLMSGGVTFAITLAGSALFGQRSSS